MNNSTPETVVPRRKVRVLWILVGVILLCVVWFFFQLFGPNSPIAVSKQTTFITEPLGPDGLPDYRAYLLMLASEGVTPENNAAVLIWQAMWPGGLAQEHWLPMCNALGMKQVPSTGMVEPHDKSVVQLVIQDLEEQGIIKRSVNEDENGENGGEYGGGFYGSSPRSLASDTIDEAEGRPWTSKQLPTLAQWISQNRKSLDILVEASKRPRYFSPSPSTFDNSSGLLIATLLPDIQMMRGAMRALHLRAMWHLGEDRSEEAWQDILACLRLARLTSEDQTLVGQLVAIAINNISCMKTNLLLHYGGLSASEARMILAELNQLAKPSDCLRALDQAERLCYLDTSLFLARGGESMNDWGAFGIDMSGFRAIDFTRIDWNIVLNMGNTWYDNLVSAAKLPTRKRRQGEFNELEIRLNETVSTSNVPQMLLGSLFSDTKRSREVGKVMLGLFLPTTSAAFNAEDRAATHFELTRLAAALAVYRAEQGEYPEQLTDLVPAIIPKLPLDMYSGKPFLYQRKDDGGYLLYSVYENEVDDLGSDYSGEIIKGEWAVSVDSEEPESFDSEESDLVIRMPVPPFKFPTPLSEEDYEYGGLGGEYAE